MKNKILKIFFTMAFTFFIGLTSVNAFNTSLSPSKAIVNSGDTFTIKLNVSGLTNKLGSVNYDVAFDNALFEYESCSGSGSSNLVNNVLKIAYYDASGGLMHLIMGHLLQLHLKQNLI